MLQLNDMSWLGADFICRVHYFKAILDWSHGGDWLCFTLLHWMSIIIIAVLQTPRNQYSEFVQDIITFLCNNNANLAPEAFWLGCRLKPAVDVCGLLDTTLFFHYNRLKSDYSRWGNRESPKGNEKTSYFTCWPVSICFGNTAVKAVSKPFHHYILFLFQKKDVISENVEVCEVYWDDFCCDLMLYKDSELKAFEY